MQGFRSLILTRIWRGLFSISLDLHTTTDSSVGFSTRQISNVDESVVEGGQQVDDTEVVLLGGSTTGWGSEVGNFFFLDLVNLLLGRLKFKVSLKRVFYLPLRDLYLIMIKTQY